MDVKRFFLSYYGEDNENFYITKITEPKAALNPHSHGYYQIYYLISGRLVHHLEDSEASLSEGEVFILPPDVVHYIEAKGENLAFYAASFMPEYLSEMKNSSKLAADFLYYLNTASVGKILPKFNIPSEDVLLVGELFRRMENEFSSKSEGGEEIIKACLSVLVTLFARNYFKQNDGSLYSEQLRRAAEHSVEYINVHFDEPLTLDAMARRVAMSKTSFCRLFKEITGKSFKDYLNEYRIRQAASLISSGEKISAAARRVGFEYFSTFYRNFKKIMGVSATEYGAQK